MLVTYGLYLNLEKGYCFGTCEKDFEYQHDIDVV